MRALLHRTLLIPALLLPAATGRSQFFDGFDGGQIEGWFTQAGDGRARVAFQPHDGFARMQADGTQDPHNVWWTIIKRDVSGFLDLEKLADPAYELRVEARVRPSHAPRRVNFMLNTQRTTDFHEHLREYDLAEKGGWHTISFTTEGFDARPGDQVFVQLGVTDWGPGTYHLDIDYYRADIVRKDESGPDVGEPLIYHPPVPELGTFEHHLPVDHDSLVHVDFPEVNFNDWSVATPAGPARVLTVGARQWPILRWEFGNLRGRKAAGAGVLELTTQAVPRGGRYVAAYGEDLGIEFGKIRVIEILGGDPAWDQETVTYQSLLQDGQVTDVFNPQMIFDVEVADEPGGRTVVTLPRPVMQRLLDGTTRGLVLRPLGALTPSVYASEDPEERGPRLHFSTSR